MRYTVHAPPPALRRFVESLWSLAGEGTGLPPDTIVPDGCMELIVHCGDRFMRLAPAGEEAQPRAFVVGQMTRALVVRPGARVDTWGVRFRPGGAAAILGPGLEALADRIVALRDLWSGDGRVFEARCLEARSSRERRRVLERLLLGRLGRGGGIDVLAEAAARRILRARGAVSVANLADGAGVGRRQLERRFRSAVGVAPRTLARLARFQHLFQLLRGAAPLPQRGAWAEIACAAGYYDQSHLLLDFREFAGTTPPRFLEAQGELSRRFTDRERLEALFGE